MRLAAMLLLLLGDAGAYECNLLFPNKTISVVSRDLCGYINYHLIMLPLCGTIVILTLMITYLCWICKAQREAVENGMGIAGSCCAISILGFEGPVVFLLLVAYLFILYSFLRCHWHMLQMLLCGG